MQRVVPSLLLLGLLLTACAAPAGPANPVTLEAPAQLAAPEVTVFYSPT